MIKINVINTDFADVGNISFLYGMDHCWNVAFYGAETLALQKIDKKYLESFEMTHRRRIEKISWPDRVSNEEVLHTAKEERNIIHTITRRKDTRIGYILRRNCLL
jgi:hypothetical protein